MKYELFYLIGSTKEIELENIKKEVAAIIEENGGAFEEKEVVEKRKMSYEIKHETHGVYIARRFEMESEKVDNVIKKLNLNAGVLRFVISRASELPELKTKEERLEETKRKTAARPEEKKVASPATSPATRRKGEKVEEKETNKKTSEDIDKKLEEILNI